MAGLAVQNFVSAGVGIAVADRLHPRPRRRARATSSASSTSTSPGRSLYVLLPLSIVVGLVLVSQGVMQTSAAPGPRTLTGGDQTLALGPVASQEAIKELGTNGGGFFNVNSAMPFENPTWLSNFVEMLAILVDPGRRSRPRTGGWSATAARAGRSSAR